MQETTATQKYNKKIQLRLATVQAVAFFYIV